MRDTSFVRHVAASNWEYDDCEKRGWVRANVQLHFIELASHKIFFHLEISAQIQEKIVLLY